MRQGTLEAKITAQARKMGMPVPDKFKNKPVLRVGLDFYRRAFWDCSTDRDIGMSEGPIPWSSIDRWARRYGIADDEFDRLVHLLRSMDNVYIEERAKKAKKGMGRKKGGSGSIKTKGPIRMKHRMM